MNLTLMELAAKHNFQWGQNHVNRGYEEDTFLGQWWPGQQRQRSSPKIDHHQAAGTQMKGTEDEYFDFEQLTKS